eukprot:TRINITY_DN14265_c0_g1_i1.p1 TRINITY_DN14265_c0_g1~~TRINITY_DN14265_c0_g1_i1.p1  ORF type:complete len:686 (+),score=83.65 TRINITY_DN14265_c0_g1_i1:85-2142(+)
MAAVEVNSLEDVPLEAWVMWIVTAINVANVFIYLAVLSCSVYKSVSCLRCCRAIASRWRSWRDGVPHYLAATDEHNAFERKVHALAAEARVERGRHFSRLCVHTAFVMSILIIVTFGYTDLTLWFDVARARWEISQSNWLQVTICLAWATYAWLYPDKMTGNRFSLWHAMMFVRMMFQCCTTESLYQLWALEQTLGALRFWAALGLGTPRLTLGLNFVLSMMKLYMYNMFYGKLETEEEHFVYMNFGSIRPFAFHEGFLCFTAWSMTVILESWTYAASRAQMHAKASSNSESTVKSMLVVLCDVVVTVDEDLRFDNSATEVAQFLLRQPHNNSYQGTSFLDLMEDADRDRIRQQISSSLIGHGTTLSLSARLVDGNGNLMYVQMYCTCFLDISDHRAYIIGILELRDPTAGVRDDTVALQHVDESINGARGSGALNAAVEWGGDNDSFKSVDTIEAAAIPLVSDEDEIEIWINLAEDAIPIMDTSRLVRTMTGPESCIGASFLEWLPKSEAPQVVSRISEGFRHFMEEPCESLALVDVGEFHLRPPHARRAGLEYLARMQMDMTRLLDPDLPDGPVCVCLRPVDIAVQKMARQKRNDRTIGSLQASSLPSRGESSCMPESESANSCTHETATPEELSASSSSRDGPSVSTPSNGLPSFYRGQTPLGLASRATSCSSQDNDIHLSL